MKISYQDDEIIVDFTKTNILINNPGDKDIVLLKANYLVPIPKRVPKSYSYYNRHKVNAHYLNCTCKEYKDSIKLYPLRDLRRICRHIYFIITKEYQNRIDDLTLLLLSHRFWDKIHEVFQLEFRNENIFVGFDKDINFIRVYRKFSQWKFYTFLKDEKIWINNLPPYKSSLLNSFLIEYLLDLPKKIKNR